MNDAKGGGGSEGVTLIFYLKHTLTFGRWCRCEGLGGLQKLLRVGAFHPTTCILSQMPTFIAMFVCPRLLIASYGYVLKVVTVV